MPDLADIVGQEDAISRLQRAMAAERVPHAYIFAGPAGVGRRTTAVALARTLLCAKPLVRTPAAREPAEGPSESPESPPFRQACGKCDDCRMMDAGSHPDFHLIYKELAGYHEDPRVRDRKMQGLSVDVVRSFLIGPAGRWPARGRGKVFLVLEAELLTQGAQNALLKTLEEPPAGVTIILICTQSAQLLPTTLSRCWIIHFGLLPKGFVTERLLARGLPKPEAEFWADFTGGSLGKAIDLAEKQLYDVKRELLGHLAGSDEVELAAYLVKVMDSLAKAA
ncbi:MAG: DNA polymerase III subunit, partial [Planctomycetota bacterium]